MNKCLSDNEFFYGNKDLKIGSAWVANNSGNEFEVMGFDAENDEMYICLGLSGSSEITAWAIVSDFREQFSFVRPPIAQGRKDDTSKRRYSLLPSGTVNSVVDVLEAGAIKYAPDNWRKVPDARRRYYDAAMRHIDAWWSGELKDDETGLPHLAHAMCCLLFLMWFDSEDNQ